jgi:hypothetical protein
MTQNDRFEISQGNPFQEQFLTAVTEGLGGGGVVGRTDLKVSAKSDNSGVDVASGDLWQPDSTISFSSASLSASGGDSTYDRWDLVAANTSTDTLVYNEGTAESNPTPPFPGSNEFPLAFVFVPANGGVESSNVFNWRPPASQLQDIRGVDDSSASAGQLLIYHGTDGEFQAASLGAGNGLSTTTGDASLSLAVDSDSIDTDELAANAVTSSEITDGTVTNTDLNNSSVTVAGNSVSLGSSTTVSVDDLSDVASSSESAGQTLLYHGTNSQFENAGVTAGTGVSTTTGDASLTLSLDESVLEDGGGKELDVADLAGGLGTSNQLPLTDGSAVSWGTAPNASLTNDTITRTAGDGLKYSSGSAGTALGGSSTLAIEPADFAGNGLEDDGSDDLAVSTDAIQTDEVDLSISPAWTGTHDYTGGGLQLPSGTAKSPTTESQIAWDSDDDKIKVGDSSSTVTVVNESRSLTGGNAIDSLGDLSADRTIAVSSDSIQTGELDLSITPTWTGKHQFNSGIDIRADLEDDTTTIWDSSGGHIEQSALENDTITRTAGTGLTYSSGSAGTALGGSATIGIPADGVTGTEIDLSDIAGDNITVDSNNDELDTPAWSTVTKSSNYTASNYENVLVDASSSAVTVTLPSVATDLMVTIKATDATNTVTIASPNAETIDGDSNRTIDQKNVALTITSDGSNYYIV